MVNLLMMRHRYFLEMGMLMACFQNRQRKKHFLLLLPHLLNHHLHLLMVLQRRRHHPRRLLTRFPEMQKQMVRNHQQ